MRKKQSVEPLLGCSFDELLKGRIVIDKKVSFAMEDKKAFVEAYKNTKKIDDDLTDIVIQTQGDDSELDNSEYTWYSEESKQFHCWEGNAWAYNINKNYYNILDDMHKSIFHHWLFFWPFGTVIEYEDELSGMVNLELDMLDENLHSTSLSYMVNAPFAEMKLKQLEKLDVSIEDSDILDGVIKMKKEYDFWIKLNKNKMCLSDETIKSYLQTNHLDILFRQYLEYYLKTKEYHPLFHVAMAPQLCALQNLLGTTDIRPITHSWQWETGEYRVYAPCYPSPFHSISFDKMQKIHEVFREVGENFCLI